MYFHAVTISTSPSSKGSNRISTPVKQHFTPYPSTHSPLALHPNEPLISLCSRNKIPITRCDLQIERQANGHRARERPCMHCAHTYPILAGILEAREAIT